MLTYIMVVFYSELLSVPVGPNCRIVIVHISGLPNHMVSSLIFFLNQETNKKQTTKYRYSL